jgi:hypothetical protein
MMCTNFVLDLRSTRRICAMKLPGGDAATVDRQKLTGYCLNRDHLRGKHKARVFATLGFTVEKCRCVASRVGQGRGHS